mgnify:CR=1 FL=1
MLKPKVAGDRQDQWCRWAGEASFKTKLAGGPRDGARKHGQWPKRYDTAPGISGEAWAPQSRGHNLESWTSLPAPIASRECSDWERPPRAASEGDGIQKPQECGLRSVGTLEGPCSAEDIVRAIKHMAPDPTTTTTTTKTQPPRSLHSFSSLVGQQWRQLTIS